MRSLLAVPVVVAFVVASARAAFAPGPRTAPVAPSLQAPAERVSIEVETQRALRTFRPAAAVGGALDGHSAGETAQIYSTRNLRLMARAGLGDISYRLRTELGVEAWHIDPAGHFSSPAAHDGYWTSASRPTRGLRVSWGYQLPRRGDTTDQADDAGFSRLDDGSLRTFWKSDPYLDRHYTHEPDSQHPQWVLIDIGRVRRVDAIKITWAAPHATRFDVQRFVGSSAPVDPGAGQVNPFAGQWVDFPIGRFAGHGGAPTLRLAPEPIPARYVRVLMSESSHTGPAGSHDIRDRLGYAIREVALGTLALRGRLRDLLVHRASGTQSEILVSSTDPWHSAADRDPGYEQPSFQTVTRSGLTRRLPMLVPVPVLYGTPENAVAEIRYLRALKVPLRGVELGEEPDGQFVSPEDYGALYVQSAKALHHAFPHLALGGPGFQTSTPDWLYWPDSRSDTSWTRRFVKFLRRHHAMALFNFFSFEWYPFDVCAAVEPQLAVNSQTLTGLLDEQRSEGIPRRLPVYITEYGYSAFAGQAEVDFPGALLDADTVGTFLTAGGTTAYLYGYEPDALMRESSDCNTWGNLVMIQSDDQHHALRPVSTYWETQMLTHDWTQPGSGLHALYGTRVIGETTAGALVHTYAVRRPDGRVSVLVLNLSQRQPVEATLRLASASSQTAPGMLQEWQLSSADYRWNSRGPAGAPRPDRPPIHSLIPGARAVRLPPFSITVLQTRPRLGG